MQCNSFFLEFSFLVGPERENFAVGVLLNLSDHLLRLAHVLAIILLRLHAQLSPSRTQFSSTAGQFCSKFVVNRRSQTSSPVARNPPLVLADLVFVIVEQNLVGIDAAANCDF